MAWRREDTRWCLLLGLGLLGLVTGRTQLPPPLTSEALVRAIESLPEDDLAVLRRAFLKHQEGRPRENPEEERMMGDMPRLPEPNVTELALAELQRSNRESWEGLGGRHKEVRLNWIKFQILSTLGRNGQEPNIGQGITNQTQKYIMDVYNKMSKMPKVDDTEYTEKLQSFYASCDMPRNTDEELWNHGDTMNLHFELTLPTAMSGNAISIVAARLRLYKLSQGNGTGASNEECAPGLESIIKKSHSPHFPDSGVQHQPIIDGKQIRVSIYWYTRSLKKNKIRKKLLDSQMVSVYGDMWTEWNVLSAIRAWKESGKNFGIAVEVEDEDRVLLPASKYFAPMNCSKEASTSRPIPGFLFDAMRALGGDNSKSGNDSYSGWDLTLEPLPMIDLCTKEIPETEMPNDMQQNAEYSIESSQGHGQHRVRHHNHHGHHHYHHHSTTTESPESGEQAAGGNIMVNMHNTQRQNFKR